MFLAGTLLLLFAQFCSSLFCWTPPNYRSQPLSFRLCSTGTYRLFPLLSPTPFWPADRPANHRRTRFFLRMSTVSIFVARLSSKHFNNPLIVRVFCVILKKKPFVRTPPARPPSIFFLPQSWSICHATPLQSFSYLFLQRSSSLESVRFFFPWFR